MHYQPYHLEMAADLCTDIFQDKGYADNCIKGVIHAYSNQNISADSIRDTPISTINIYVDMYGLDEFKKLFSLNGITNKQLETSHKTSITVRRRYKNTKNVTRSSKDSTTSPSTGLLTKTNSITTVAALLTDTTVPITENSNNNSNLALGLIGAAGYVTTMISTFMQNNSVQPMISSASTPLLSEITTTEVVIRNTTLADDDYVKRAGLIGVDIAIFAICAVFGIVLCGTFLGVCIGNKCTKKEAKLKKHDVESPEETERLNSSTPSTLSSINRSSGGLPPNRCNIM